MNGIIEIIAGWHPLGQWLFFLSIIATLCTTLMVLIRGWPPEHIKIPFLTEDDT